MAMTKKAGTALVTGIATIAGMVAQSGSKSAGGELKVYKDESGNILSLYLDDDHSEVSFEGLLKTGTTSLDKKLGDSFSALGVTGYLTAWSVAWVNDDVAKVSGSLRDYNIEEPDNSGSGTQS